MVLTAEQRATIEANKAKALERRRQFAAQNGLTSNTSHSTTPSNSVTSFTPSRPTMVRSTANSVVSNALPNVRQFTNNFSRGNSGWNRPGGPQFTRPHFQRGRMGFNSNGNFNVSWAVGATRTVFLTIHSKEHFRVEMKPFNEEVQNYCKCHPKRVFFEEKKCWTFPWSCFAEVANDLSKMKDFRLDLPMDSIVEMYRKEKPYITPDAEAMSMIYETVWDKLYSYQQQGVEKGIQFKGRILIGDEMGLGKTIQALTLAFYYRKEWPLLIVCPASVRGAWSDSCDKFFPGLCDIVTSKFISSNQKSSRQVYIISYDSLAAKVESFIAMGFHVVIFDESHMMKEKSARRTQAGIRLSQACERVILLSGTPAVRGPVELFTQIRMINPRIFRNYDDYIHAYCDAKEVNGRLDVKGASRCDELTEILKEFIMIRRTKDEVEHSLPPKTREIKYLDSDKVDTQMRELKEAQNKFKKATGKDFNDNLMEYYRATAIAKASAVTSYLENNYLTKDGIKDKLVIFGHHQVVLDTIGRMLDNNGIRYIRIDGFAQNRDELVKEFQTKEKCKVALLSMLAAGTGLTLTASHIVVFAELNWNPSHLTQAEDRVHRIGQTKPVQIHYLIAKNTADDYIFKTLKTKMKNLDAISLNTGTFEGATYSKEDANSKITNYFSTLIEQETKNEPIIKINPRRSVLGAAATGDVITIDEDSDKEKDDFDNDDIIFLDDPQKDKPKENYVIDEWSDDDDEGYGAVPKRPSSEQMSAGPSKKTKSDG